MEGWWGREVTGQNQKGGREQRQEEGSKQASKRGEERLTPQPLQLHPPEQELPEQQVQSLQGFMLLAGCFFPFTTFSNRVMWNEGAG